jgi:hypothetical protein
VKSVSAFIAGLLFGAGLAASGMTQPPKIVGFLDFFGAWDPTLLFVLAGAVGAYATALRLGRGRPAPYLEGGFESPSVGPVSGKLMAGSAIFGAGWGVSGFCPGPAVVVLGAAAPVALVFVPAMLAGMFLYRRLFSDETDACG